MLEYMLGHTRMGGLERGMMGALTTTMRRTHITNSSSRRPVVIILRCPSRCYVLHLDTWGSLDTISYFYSVTPGSYRILWRRKTILWRKIIVFCDAGRLFSVFCPWLWNIFWGSHVLCCQVILEDFSPVYLISFLLLTLGHMFLKWGRLRCGGG